MRARALVVAAALALVLAAADRDPAARGWADGEQKSALAQEAEAALAAGKVEEAIALYRRLVREEGEAHSEGLAKALHARWVVRARAARDEGELDEAIRLYGRALDAWPAIDTEREQFAVEVRLKAAAIAGELAERSRTLEAEGDAHASAGRWLKAVRAYQAAVRNTADPQRREMIAARLATARLELMKDGEQTRAREALERARQAFAERRWTECREAYAQARAVLPLALEDLQRSEQARRRLAEKDMILVKGGPVWLGNDDAGADADERPRHRVTVEAFWIDRHEVTNGQYDVFVRATGYPAPVTWPGGRVPVGLERVPVSGVSFRDARRYARWAGKRLPSEAEWVRAARGEGDWLFPYGAFFKEGRCNALERRHNGPVEVHTYPAGDSVLGVQDLLGNVLEWTSSTYGPYPGTRWEAPRGHRVLRGGAWYFPEASLRISRRYHDEPTARVRGYGFRCAMDARLD